MDDCGPQAENDVARTMMDEIKKWRQPQNDCLENEQGKDGSWEKRIKVKWNQFKFDRWCSGAKIPILNGVQDTIRNLCEMR